MDRKDLYYSFISAVREGRLENTRELINAYGLSHSQEWLEGYYLLCEAVKNKHAAVAKLLLTSGSRVTSINNMRSNTPLHFAVRNNDIEIVMMILDKGANIDAKNRYGRTPLHNAIENKNMEVTELLLKHGADANARDDDGTTPLYIATKTEHEIVTVVKLLLQHGASANVYAEHEDVLTELHIASWNGNEELVKLLLEFGAGINSRDDYGRTALHVASEGRNKDVVESLLEYGADINITSGDNHTALDYTMPGIRTFHGSDDEDYYDPDTAEDTAEALKRHIVKMKTANLYVSDKNLLSLSSSDELSDFRNECEKEITSMKSEKINNLNTSFYDILAKGTRSLAKYMRNENIVQVLKSDDFKTKFPIYASMIQCNFRKGMKRKELLEKGNKIFHFLFNNFPKLPYNCTEKIFSYMSDADLRILMDACKHLGICNTNINNAM